MDAELMAEIGREMERLEDLVVDLRAENERLRKELRESLAQHDWVAAHFDIHCAHTEQAKEALK